MRNLTKIKLIKTVSLALTALIVVTGSMFFYYFQCMDPIRYSVGDNPPYSAPLDMQLTRKQAVEDLDHFYRIMSTRHLAWIDGRSDISDKIYTRYKTIRASLQDGVTVFELYQSIRELTAMLDDLHTRVNWIGNVLPDNIEALKAAVSQYKVVSSVDGIPYETLVATYELYTPYELDGFLSYALKSYIYSEVSLRLCGIDTSDGVDYTFDTGAGEYTVHCDFYTPEPEPETEPEEEDNSWVSYQINEARGIANITIKKCRYNEYYVNQLKEFFAAVKAKGIENIVLDLRNNGGGTMQTAQAFISYLGVDSCRLPDQDNRYGWYIYKQRNMTLDCAGDNGYTGNLYVLTNIGTGSGAMYFAMIVKDNGLGTLIGQASCNLPDMYTGVVTYSTPNAKLMFNVSLFKWYRIDESVPAWSPLTPDYVTASGEEMEEVYRLIG